MHTHATLTIDLAAIAANYRMLADKVAPAACAAVVKADAYGLGVGYVAPMLAKAGCRMFYVATPEEGVSLRALLPDLALGIGVFHGLPLCAPTEALVALYTDHTLTPVLNSLTQLERWCQYADGAPAILHIDTGMKRLGESMHFISGLQELCTGPSAPNISMLLSHLACPDTPDHAINAAQREQCLTLRKALPDIPLSVSSSSGVFLGRNYDFDEVRPGAALYGINPTPGQANPMRNVVTLTAPILHMRTVQESGTVGYGAGYAVSAGDRLAVIGVGYADGILRNLSESGTAVIHHGQGQTTVPFAGRVSMDLVTLDISVIAETALSNESYAELIGPNQPVDVLAGAAGTIGYELFTRLGPRLRRDYLPV